MKRNAMSHSVWRLFALLLAAAVFTGGMTMLAPVVALAADCAITHVGPCPNPGDPDDGDDAPPPPPPPPPDPCAVLTHIPEHCLQPDPDDDPDECPDLSDGVLTHVVQFDIPEECLEPGPDECPDLSDGVLTHVVQFDIPEECLEPGSDECPDLSDAVLTHVVQFDIPEECLEPDDDDEPEGDQDGGDGSDDDSDTTGDVPGPASPPDLPLTGGSYLVYGLAGGVLTATAVVSLFQGRRRERG